MRKALTLSAIALTSSIALAVPTVAFAADGRGGTAKVEKVADGNYGVDAFAGGKKFDTVKFSTDATDNPKPKPAPVDPKNHKTPKGSVNTGQAPLGWVPSDAAAHG
ncbi:hypothetical protein J7F03_29195 [Streptomyces sp. ISL-43]|uniref:hypothetical protein n=1 Tax=Streptomyces sp. ISL-43 TaxID=2819183 RepID=UPI001BED1140|nr:hypothetical protein [Streptomyces sp. ISL-43]MBT2451080.1 hypothetical protein [Streptomyces sp. ISL-43]